MGGKRRRPDSEAQDNLISLIKEYYQLEREIKRLSEQKEPLNKKIKSLMRAQNLERFLADDIVATFRVQVRNSLIEDQAVKKLKALRCTNAIKLKETVDQDEVDRLIQIGRLDPAVLDDCWVAKEIEYLTVSRI